MHKMFWRFCNPHFRFPCYIFSLLLKAFLVSKAVKKTTSAVQPDSLSLRFTFRTLISFHSPVE